VPFWWGVRPCLRRGKGRGAYRVDAPDRLAFGVELGPPDAVGPDEGDFLLGALLLAAGGGEDDAPARRDHDEALPLLGGATAEEAGELLVAIAVAFAATAVGDRGGDNHEIAQLEDSLVVSCQDG